ncbi:helix-turn-helix domain-containing protein [Nocardia halotolerans]|uniref:Helix-turn-helix domain-containing protein n=1 Tax=Nocardia halotolerans TaxID=1755878 RepID=A0ABV8VBH8_9NOCA
MTEGPRTLDQALGRVIARRRSEGPWSQKEMADLLGTSRARLANFEQGRQPIPQTFLWECAALFSCQPSDFMIEAEELLRAQGIVPTASSVNPTVRNIGRSLGF